MLVNPRALLHIDGNIGNVVQKLLILFAGAAFIMTRPAHRGVIGLICAIAVLTLVCAIGTDYPGFQWRLYCGGLASIVAPFVLLTAQPQARDRQLVLLVFGFLPVLMVLLGGLFQAVGMGHVITPDASGGSRLSGTQDAPAFLAGAAFTGTFAALELAEQWGLGYMGLFLLDIVVLVFAGGRTALALAVFVCAIAYLRSFRRVPLLKFFVPIWLLSLAAVAFVVLPQRGNAIQHLMSTSLSNRDLIWAVLRRHLDAHPWFGVGLGNQQSLMYEGLKSRGAGTLAGHNEYLRIGVELGYPGAILFFLLTWTICFLVWKSVWVRKDPIFLVGVVTFYLYALTDNAFLAPQIFFFLTVASFAGRGESAAPIQNRSPFPAVPPALPVPQRAQNPSGPS
jgi:O-antigen ligase